MLVCVFSAAVPNHVRINKLPGYRAQFDYSSRQTRITFRMHNTAMLTIVVNGVFDRKIRGLLAVVFLW